MIRLYWLYWIFATSPPSHFINLLLSMGNSHRYTNLFITIFCTPKYLKSIFIPDVINEQNKLDPGTRSFVMYCKDLSAQLRRILSISYQCFSRSKRISQAARCEHEFGNSLMHMLHSLSPHIVEAESTIHYFLLCHLCNTRRPILVHDLKWDWLPFSTLNDNKLTDLLLYGNGMFESSKCYSISISKLNFQMKIYFGCEY